MIKLFKYLKGYTLQSIVGPLFKMLEAVFELIVPLVMARIIDVGIAGGDISYIYTMGGVLLALGALGLACSLTAQYFAARAAMGFGTALRREMLSHMLNFSHAELDNTGTPAMITRMTNDINIAQNGVNMLLRLFLRAPFIAVGAIIMAFTINTKIALIFLAATPVIGIIIFVVTAVTVPLFRKIGAGLDKISGSVREAVVGTRVIRSFGRQDDECKRFNSQSRVLRRMQLFTGRISALQSPLTQVVLNLAIVLILYFGAVRVYNGILTQGQVIALVNYMTQILLALVALAFMIVLLARAAASAARINEVFTVVPTVTDTAVDIPAPKVGAPRAEFRNVSFSYAAGGERRALSDMSFTLPCGSTLGIIGGTGAGKSTVAALLVRAYDASAGEVFLDGTCVRNYPLSELCRRVAIVPQTSSLLTGSLRDNLKMGRDIPDDKLMSALEIAQATHVAGAHGGLDAYVSAGGVNFSGGERQRLCIARALAGDPEVLILDDSASALDYATDAHLRHALRALPGLTLIIISQRTASISGADEILVLDDGEIVARGSHEELLRDCEIYREIHLSQTGGEQT